MKQEERLGCSTDRLNSNFLSISGFKKLQIKKCYQRRFLDMVRISLEFSLLTLGIEDLMFN